MGTYKTEGMARKIWINQLGKQKLKFQVSKRSELICQRYSDCLILKTDIQKHTQTEERTLVVFELATFGGS